VPGKRGQWANRLAKIRLGTDYQYVPIIRKKKRFYYKNYPYYLCWSRGKK